MEDLAWHYPAEPIERAAVRYCEAVAKWRGKPELETVRVTYIIVPLLERDAKSFTSAVQEKGATADHDDRFSCALEPHKSNLRPSPAENHPACT